MTRSCLLSLGVFVLTAVPALTAPAPAPPKVPRELLEARLKAARNVAILYQKRYRLGRARFVETLPWSERCLDAELALAEKKADRVAALAAYVRRTRAVEERIKIMAAYPRGPRDGEVEEATYYRVQAEIRYFEATGKSLPPAKDEKGKPEPVPAKRGPEGEK